MKLLPVALNVEGRRCLVVGGGAVAARKVESLLECGARVEVVAPALSEALTYLKEEVIWSARRFQAGDCAGFALIFACTGDRAVNAAIAGEACEHGIWCNVADDATASDFHAAAALRRGEVCIGISTGGGSPALARFLKARLAECIGPEYEALLAMLSARRERLELETQAQRAALWHAILESDALELLRAGRHAAAEELVDKLMAAGKNTN